MATSVVDAEGNIRLLSFAIQPGHTEEDWLNLFNKTRSLCRRAETAICHCDGEVAIKNAFYASDVFSTCTKQTCVRHGAWSMAASKPAGQSSTIGSKVSESYHAKCMPASCQEEYMDACTEVATKLRRKGEDQKADHILELREQEKGYWSFTPVMMNGQLATGIIECIWRLLKTTKSKRTLLMVVNAMLRVGCDLSRKPLIDERGLQKDFDDLQKHQTQRAGHKLDMATHGILHTAHQKLSRYGQCTSHFVLVYVCILILILFQICNKGTTSTSTISPRHGIEWRHYLSQPQRSVLLVAFRPVRDRTGRWECKTHEGGMCWSNTLFGIPCVHILCRWHHLINDDEIEFNFGDVELSVHKMYRTATYAATGANLKSVKIVSVFCHIDMHRTPSF